MTTQMRLRPVDKLKEALNLPAVKEQFNNALKENSDLFVSSLIDLFVSDANLQKCDPSKVIMEAMKAATLKLPINKSLGWAYVIPYGGTPQFQMGYKGYVQLAQRSGQLKTLNAGTVLKGELRSYDKMTGELDINGEPTSAEVIGFFAFFKTTCGFEKASYITVEEAKAHGLRFSKSYQKATSPWQTNFEAMGTKTVLLRLLTKYAPMSTDMLQAISFEEPSAAVDSAIDTFPEQETEPRGRVVDAEFKEVFAGPSF